VKRNWLARCALLLFAAALVAGLLALTGAYASAGNGYAEYSSLRTDQGGSKVLYDALAATGLVPVRRNYGYLPDLHAHKTTIFIIGISPDDLDSGDYDVQTLEKIAQDNRLVIALAPGGLENQKNSALEKRWGIHLKEGNDDGDCQFAFDRFAGWTDRYTVQTTIHGRAGDKNTCGIERSFGSGRIALLSTPFKLTNQGLVSNRDAGLISDMTGPSTQIIFDESHLGMLETGSAVGLARKYRLQGLLWGFALLAGVFIWKTAEPFPPPPGEDAERAPVSGRDAHTGFLRLLERHIPPARLIEECLRQWRLTSPRKDLPTGLAAGDPVTAYRAVQHVLTSKPPYVP
jgi:hypothetical protein